MSNEAKSGTASQGKSDVIPIDQKLVPPFIDGISPDEALPLEWVREGYKYRIDPYPGMAVGQEVEPYVEYVGHGYFFGQARVITEDNLGADLTFNAHGFLAPIRNGSVELYFVVKHTDGSKTGSKRRVYPIVD
ncbi:hypothetical protein BK666_06065 [Pseudomonas frederiksbergensis]|uniref:Uncharacterized protein n=1 Tax=Pseudomonas frederiksbergensis TaxID=104087 RepID=A0A423KCI1_9PSED|nr:hypothetical protein [Pseudomonas frederiksbergensis]RON49975.1 hypothetical protein BK666_06065 [Pseudomonas frederiksbergensis]